MDMKFDRKESEKQTMGIIILTVVLTIIISYGLTLLFTGLGMWALAKLGVLDGWSWGQSALWAIVIEVVLGLLRSIRSK